MLQIIVDANNNDAVSELIGPTIIGPVRANHPLFVRLVEEVDALLTIKFAALKTYYYCECFSFITLLQIRIQKVLKCII